MPHDNLLITCNANMNVNVNAKLGSGIKLGYLISVCGWASECEAKRTEAENASVRAIKILLGRGGTRRCRPADVSRRTTISTRPDNYGTARTDPGPSETSSETRRRKRERTQRQQVRGLSPRSAGNRPSTRQDASRRTITNCGHGTCGRHHISHPAEATKHKTLVG